MSNSTAAACYFARGGKAIVGEPRTAVAYASLKCVTHLLLQLRVAIVGSGFSRDRFTGGNTVYFGKGVCTVLNHKTSDTLVSS